MTADAPTEGRRLIPQRPQLHNPSTSTTACGGGFGPPLTIATAKRTRSRFPAPELPRTPNAKPLLSPAGGLTQTPNPRFPLWAAANPKRQAITLACGGGLTRTVGSGAPNVGRGPAEGDVVPLRIMRQMVART